MEGVKCKKDEHSQTQMAVAFVPFPAQGHLNQLLHLSHLISTYGLPVHYVGSSSHNRQAKLRLLGWDKHCSSNLHFHNLQLPLDSSPPPNPDSSSHFPTHLHPLFDAVIHLREPVFQVLQQLSTKYTRIAVIYDSIMASVAQNVKLIPNAKTYSFFSLSAFTYSMVSWQELLNKPFPLDSDILKPLPSLDACFSPHVWNFILHQQQLSGFESGCLFNTSKVIEGKYLQLLEKLYPKTESLNFALGPFNPIKVKNKEDNDRHICLHWLDTQESGTVIYVSFGSTTSMLDEQIEELAMGLERSGVKFLWVLRRADSCDVFAFTNGEARKPQLPEGYEERVKNRGMVVRDWAPQLEILAHPSIGGFISHCGWNSCMESMSMGVPIAAWPMHSDQPRNAVLLTEVLRIGILIRDWEHRDEVVKSPTIEKVMRRLMASSEGMEMRKRAAELGDMIRASVDEDGVSRSEMDRFISHISIP